MLERGIGTPARVHNKEKMAVGKEDPRVLVLRSGLVPDPKDARDGREGLARRHDHMDKRVLGLLSRPRVERVERSISRRLDTIPQPVQRLCGKGRHGIRVGRRPVPCKRVERIPARCLQRGGSEGVWEPVWEDQGRSRSGLGPGLEERSVVFLQEVVEGPEIREGGAVKGDVFEVACVGRLVHVCADVAKVKVPCDKRADAVSPPRGGLEAHPVVPVVVGPLWGELLPQVSGEHPAEAGKV